MYVIFINHLAPVVRRADNFIHWISHYPAYCRSLLSTFQQKDQLTQLLRMASTDQLFQFDGQLYEQCVGVAMSLPLDLCWRTCLYAIWKKDYLAMI